MIAIGLSFVAGIIFMFLGNGHTIFRRLFPWVLLILGTPLVIGGGLYSPTWFFSDYLSQTYTVTVWIMVCLYLCVFRGKRCKNYPRFEYDALLFFSTCGALILGLSRNYVGVFLGFEILSIPLYILVASRRDWISLEASIKYFIVGAFSSALFLMGIACILIATGSLWMGATTPLQELIPLLMLGKVMVGTTFLFKLGFIPFHFWLPDVYQGSPLSFLGFMAVMVKLAGFMIAVRLINLPFMDNTTWIILAVLTLITLVVATITMLSQQSFKRMMGYSAIANTGFMSLILLSRIGASGEGLFLLVSIGVYALSIWAVFFGLGILKQDADDPSIQSLRGCVKKHPVATGICCAGLLSLAGFPPFPGFFIKAAIMILICHSQHWGLLWVALITSLIGMGTYLNYVMVMLDRRIDD